MDDAAWPVTRQAPVNWELPTPEKFEGESNSDHRAREMRWRRWAAHPRPDLWHVTADEVKFYERWVRNGHHAPNARPGR